MQAYTYQTQNNPQQALQIYTEILNSTTLADSVIEKHLTMKNQCHRNLGEVFEQMSAFDHAKYHYTQALKYNPENSVAWTRLGFINYEKMGDFDLAKKCFQAAARTMPTLDKIGTKVCTVLVKLAEISFLEADFPESEKIVDAIIVRQSADKKTLLFAYLLKYYFLVLKSQNDHAQTLLHKAQMIQPDAKISDLDLFKRIKAREMPQAIVFDRHKQAYSALEGHPKSLLLEASNCDTFPAFLIAFMEAILRQTDLDSFMKHEFVYDCSQFIQLLEQKKSIFKNSWGQNLSPQQQQCKDQPMVEQKPSVKPTKVDKAKILRKKLDNSEQQIRAINLGRFQQYREHVYKTVSSFQDDQHSSHEILSFAKLLTSGSLQQENTLDQVVDVPQRTLVPDIAILDDFHHCLATKMHLKSCQYFVRNLLRYLCSHENIINYQNAPQLFKLFLMRLDESTLELTQPEVLLMMFELTLFNQQVIKETKSTKIMSLRTQLYDFCHRNYSRFIGSCAQFNFRLAYAMMFTAFEIKNDMVQSVQFYDLLDFTLLKQQKSFLLPWVSSTFQLDLQQVSHFGNQKIKEAQKINTQNQQLREMKQNESESLKTVYQRQKCSKHTALFYLQQFFQHLKTLLVHQVDSFGVNFQLNDDKLKEAWDQLIFCLIRVQPTSCFFMTANHVFSILSAFKASSSGMTYENVLLKKIDFAPLLEEISERLRALVQESHVGRQSKQPYAEFKTLTAQLLISHQVEPQTLNKLLVHLTRILSADFIFYNVKVGGSSGNQSDPGQPIMTQFLRCLFYLELIKSNLLGDQMHGVALLLKQLDQMAQEQQDLLMRAYSKLFIVSFPLMLRVALNGAKDPDFLLLIEKSLRYLFNFKAPNSQIQDIEEVQQQFEFDEVTELSLFAGMKIHQEKPKYPLPTPAQLFTQIVQRNKELDWSLLHDVVVYVDMLSLGRLLTPSKQQQLEEKDISNCIKITDTLSKLLSAQSLSKRDEESITALRQKFFKENPFSQIRKPACYDDHHSQGLHTVVVYLMNMYGSLAVQVYPQNVPMPFNKRYQLIERLQSLKDLSKLRNFVRMDLNFSPDLGKSALLNSIIELQYYTQASSSKLLLFYKNADQYRDQRQYKDIATNACLWSLQLAYDNRDIDRCLEAMHQLLTIFYARVMTERDTTKPKFEALTLTVTHLSLCCELIQQLTVQPKKDPRVKSQNNLNELREQAFFIVQNLLDECRKSYTNQTQKKQLVADVKTIIENLRLFSTELHQHVKCLPKDQLNPDYPYIQLQMVRFSGQDNQQMEIKLARQTFDLACASKDNLMVLESIIWLVEIQLAIAINLKYRKQRLSDTNSLLEQFTRLFLTDAENQIQRLLQQNNSSGDDQIMVDDQNGEEVLFDQKASHLVRQKLNLPFESQDQLLDGIILRLYKIGDTLITVLEAKCLADQWTSLRLKKLLQCSLIDEITLSGRQTFALLAEVTAESLIKDLFECEDKLAQKLEALGQQPIFCTQQFLLHLNTVQERSTKSLVTMFWSQQISRSLTEVKQATKLQLLRLWEKTQDYEQIQQLYKKQLEIYKRSVVSGTEKYREHHEAFLACKESLITTLVQTTDTKLQYYMSVRAQYLNFNKQGKGQGYTECRQVFKDLQLKYQSPCQPLVKDVFELFLESHYSKSFLKKNNLITEVQKKMIRNAVVKVCSLCGPDQETEPGHPKFLDLSKITDDDYQFEALGICIKWQCAQLDANPKKTKKDTDLVRKLQACFEEIKGEILLLDEQITPTKTPLAKIEVSAQKVFSQKKL